MWIIILIVLAIVLAVKLNKSAKEKEFQEWQEQQRQVFQESVERIANTEFFQVIKEQLLEANKKHIVELLELGKEINEYSLPTIFVTQSAILSTDYKIVNINFNNLGFKALTTQERGDLEKAITTLGYSLDPPEYDMLNPKYEYWQPMIMQIIADKNKQYKNIL